ncbi:hypothetical protein DV735_g4946, partial [Chaetothyriales sp. CBS 134920]
MLSHISLLTGLISLLSLPVCSYSNPNIIHRDVAIIGGGAAGTYAAIRLRDLGDTVVLVEKDAQLGGHAHSYTPPGGVPLNYGVFNLQNYTVVQNWFARFNLALTEIERPAGNKFADFTTGEELAVGTIPAPNFTDYLAQLAKYPYIETSWNLPQPVPEDLLLPFGEFVEKHGLQDIAYTIAQLAVGNGNALDQTTVYIMKAVDRPFILGNMGTAVTAVNHTQELYEMALEELGSDALVSSTVVRASRSDKGVVLLVQTPNGKTIIKAKKLVIAAPPTLANLNPFDLDEKEQGIFSQFQHKAVYVGLIKEVDLLAGHRYYNGDPNTTYHLPELPTASMIWPTKAEGIFWAWYNSAIELPVSTVKSHMIQIFKNLLPTSSPSLVAFKDHSPMTLSVPSDKIRNGFYNDLLSLQGYRNTWYTGSTWISDHSASVWNFTEYQVLPIFQKSHYDTPKHPIVLAHGLLGFDELHLVAGGWFPGVQYWRGIREALEAQGITVITTTVPTTGSIEQRAAVMGGLDSRYLISAIQPTSFRVRSLTTIATPHRGSWVADMLFRDIGAGNVAHLSALLARLRIDTGAFGQLTCAYVEGSFNPGVADDPGVAYFSYGAAATPHVLSVFRLSHALIDVVEGANDGLVSVRSSRWGRYKGTLNGVTHLDLINWTNRVKRLAARAGLVTPAFNAVAFYLSIADMLAKEGF